MAARMTPAVLMSLGADLVPGMLIVMPPSAESDHRLRVLTVTDPTPGSGTQALMAWEKARTRTVGPWVAVSITGEVDLDDDATQGAVMSEIRRLYKDDDAHLARAEGGGWRVFLYSPVGSEWCLGWCEETRAEALFVALVDAHRFWGEQS